MAKAAKLKTQTLIDPMSNVVSSAAPKGAKDYPEIELPFDGAEKLDRYLELKNQIDNLEAEKSSCYNDVKELAFTAISEEHFAGHHSNIRIKGVNTSALFMLQSRGSSFGLAEKEAFASEWGSKVAQALLVVDDKKVKINTEVWDANKAVLLAALNATDASGNRLVPESVVKSLFSVSLKVVPNALEESCKFVKSAGELARLYKQLGLISSLKG